MSAIIDGTNASSLSGTLGVTGATTLSSTLGVTGVATLSGTLAVTGATTVKTTNAKATASDLGGIVIGSNDASNALQLITTLVGGASSGVRYASLQATEIGVSTNSIALNAAGGDVLVGTATALSNAAKIQISAGTGASITTETTGTSATDHVNFRNANGKVGTITTNGTATSYNTSSDYRLKDNVAPMIGALAKVAALKPVTYKWKSDGSNGQGFIAHELQEVVPDCVTGEKDAVDSDGNAQYQGVDTSFLVATLVASIQELKAIIDTQATRIAALESV